MLQGYVYNNFDGVVPTRSTPTSAGLDVSIAESVVIEPHTYTTVQLDIAIQTQPGIYAHILERNSMAIKGLTIAGGLSILTIVVILPSCQSITQINRKVSPLP